MTRKISRFVTAEEKALFEESFKQARPLAGTSSTPASHKIPAAKHANDKSCGLDGRAAERLRRGLLKPDGRLDLHGFTEAAAHRALITFLRSAQMRGHRLVIVITGKGGQPPTLRTTRRSIWNSTRAHGACSNRWCRVGLRNPRLLASWPPRARPIGNTVEVARCMSISARTHAPDETGLRHAQDQDARLRPHRLHPGMREIRRRRENRQRSFHLFHKAYIGVTADSGKRRPRCADRSGKFHAAARIARSRNSIGTQPKVPTTCLRISDRR